MADQEEMYEKSWILRHIMDRWIGSKEIVAARRKVTLVRELVENSETKSQLYSFATGSMGDGFLMEGSDHDVMFTYKHVVVLCPDQDHEMTSGGDITNVLWMRDAKSRPGYVTLELDVHSQAYHSNLIRSMVPVGDQYFISSEMFQQLNTDRCRRNYQLNVETHGPAANILHENSKVDFDFVTCFQCPDWQKEANEWISRPRPHGWPDQALRDEIVHEGCQLVPVGYRTSADTFLQWRISFVTSERKLVHSLTHVQFLVYGLLKYFLKQISATMKQFVGETDILTSYIIKTVIFYSVESTQNSLWQEKHIFYCFMLCLSIIIAWVKAGFCPNYFISENNMFLGKVHGANQQKLLRFLIDLYNKKWGCLSVGTFMQPSLGQVVNEIRAFGSPDIRLPPPASSERKLDVTVFNELPLIYCPPDAVPVSLKLLLESKSDIDEFLAYTTATVGLSNNVLETFGDHKDFRGKKAKYNTLRKCRNQLLPLAEVCGSPGLLATYHYRTGNLTNALKICRHVLLSKKVYMKDTDKYEDLYCGREYTMLYKFQEAFAAPIIIAKSASHFCPAQLHLELSKLPRGDFLFISPLPYAIFLSFLCYHELGNTKRRDTALIHLRAAKYGKHHGGYKTWIVHNMLGICYEMVGDTQRALREYRDSLTVQVPDQYKNPAKERIERIMWSN